MRLVFVDSDSELVRCNLNLDDSFDETRVECLSKVAAALLETEGSDPEEYVFGAYRPYLDAGGFFVFVAGETELAPASPTTLEEVIHTCAYVGYVRRATDASKEQAPPEAVCFNDSGRKNSPVSSRIY